MPVRGLGTALAINTSKKDLAPESAEKHSESFLTIPA